jgi:hypothetical protein
VLTLVALRILLHFLTYRNLRVGREQVRQVAIVGSPAESERVVGLLQQAGVSLNLVGMVTPIEPQMPPNLYLNTIDRLEEVVGIFRIDELIFCSKDVPAHDIMAWMTRLGPHVLYKIVPEESLSIIGSSSKNEPGELYTIDIRYNIAQPGQRRNKRMLDVLICLVALLTSPVWMFFAAKRSLLLRYWLPVLLGRRTWVGYAAHPDNGRLPRLAPAVFTTAQGIEPEPNAAVAGRLNFLYAKDWDVWRDVRVVWFWVW